MYTKNGLHLYSNKTCKHALNIYFQRLIKNKNKKCKKLLTFVEHDVNIFIVNSSGKQIFINKYLLRKIKQKSFKKVLTKNYTLSIIQKHSERESKSTLKSKQ